MKNKWLCISFLCVLIGLNTGCQSDSSGSIKAPVDVTLTLTDTKGNVLKNRSVSLSGFDVKSPQNKQTDANGQAQFSFVWSTDDYGTAWACQATEDADFKMVNVMMSPRCCGPGMSGQVTVRDTVKMDSLKAFKVRLKSKSTNVTSLNVQVTRDGIEPLPLPFTGKSSTREGRQDIRRTFFSQIFKVNSTQLDTTLSMKVYQNTSFDLRIQSDKGSIYGPYTAGAWVNRDSVYLIEF